MEYLQEAHKLTDNVQSLESLKLQQMYHRKQIDELQLKKKVYQNYKKNQDQRNPSVTTERNTNCDELEINIYRTIEKHDSLIDYLGM